MASEWRKCENEAGFPYYVRDDPPARQWNHPAFVEITEKVDALSNIKYATYRMAHKVKLLQDHLKVPAVRLISGVFAHHCLSISESSFVLEPCELEAILTDIYFAAHKEGTFAGDVDAAAEIVLNFLLNAYDSERTSSVSIQAAKTGLVILTDDLNCNKWHFLFSMMADHNGCISPRRLTSLFTQFASFAEYIGEKMNFGRHLVQAEVDKCFAKTPGMLGLSEHGLYQRLEAESSPNFLSWMDVRTRLDESILQNDGMNWKCSMCNRKNPTGLKFKCTKCWGMMVCEKCYLYNDIKLSISSTFYKHRKSHTVKEVTDSEGMPPPYILSLAKNVKKVLSFPSNCRRAQNHTIDIIDEESNSKQIGRSNDKDDHDVKNQEPHKEIENEPEKHKVYTSTVGKAKGKTLSDQKTVLEDIIIKLENQNRALQNISNLMTSESKTNIDQKIIKKIDNHWHQIAAQINRLKLLQENFSIPSSNKNFDNVSSDNVYFLNKTIQKESKMMPFEVFSPIPMMPKDCINETVVMEYKTLKNDTPKHSQINVMPKNEQSKNIDSISNVSMHDISTWFGSDSEVENNPVKDSVINLPNVSKKTAYSNIPESFVSEDKFNADIESVATTNNKMKELNADLDSVLDRLQTILTNNFVLDEINFDNTQLQETASEMEGLLGSLIRGVEQRRTFKGEKIDKI